MPDGSRLSRPVYNPMITYQQTLPYKIKLTANVGWWSGGVNSAYSYIKPSMAFFWNNFRFQRYFLSDDRFAIGLSIQNPFGPYKRKFTYITQTQDYYADHCTTSPHNFSVGLTVNYRFGSMKASVKKTAASIENDDLQGRKN